MMAQQGLQKTKRPAAEDKNRCGRPFAKRAPGADAPGKKKREKREEN